jgi:hypothetical protein
MRKLLTVASVGVVLLALATAVVAECKHEQATPSACPEPTTVTKCLTAAPDQVKKINCDTFSQQDQQNGDFQCGDNGKSRTQCLDGKVGAGGAGTGDSVFCYFEYKCLPGFLPPCAVDMKTKNIHYKIRKVTVECAPAT